MRFLASLCSAAERRLSYDRKGERRIFLILIACEARNLCSVGLQIQQNKYFFVSLNENICQHDSPTEPRGVKKINGENVKKALVPWYAMGGITMAWHFNAFSERH